jgi:2-phosphosulfolactate phosphatase
VQISVDSLIEGARRSRGTVVIIDVFRAFTTAAVALSRGARYIVLTAEPEETLALRASGAVDLCMGEVSGIRPVGFDFGNSPYELSRADVRGRVLGQSTRSGTVGVCAVPDGCRIFAASLVVAGATVRQILHESPAEVTLVAMGHRGKVRADEDEVCAMYLRNLLEGRRTNHEAVRQVIGASAEAVQYGDPALPHLHPGDRDLALQVDRCDFAISVSREGSLLVARAEPTANATV